MEIFLEILLEMLSIWFSQFRCSFMVKQRKLNLDTFSMIVSSIFNTIYIKIKQITSPRQIISIDYDM